MDPAEVGKSEVVTWNGIASYFSKFPIKVTVGQLVRLYVANMLEYEPIGSFHLHARTFDVFPTGTSLIPSAHTDVITLGMAQWDRAGVHPAGAGTIYVPSPSALAGRAWGDGLVCGNIERQKAKCKRQK